MQKLKSVFRFPRPNQTSDHYNYDGIQIIKKTNQKFLKALFLNLYRKNKVN